MSWIREKKIQITIFCVLLPVIVMCGCTKDNPTSQEAEQTDAVALSESREMLLVEALIESSLMDYTYSKNIQNDCVMYECNPNEGSWYEAKGASTIEIDNVSDAQLQNYPDVKNYMDEMLNYEVLMHSQKLENEFGISEAYQARGINKTCYVLYLEEETYSILISGRDVLEESMISASSSYEELLEEIEQGILP